MMNRIKISLFLLMAMFISNIAAHAQVNIPMGVNYQCIVRDIDGKPVANQNVVINISIYSGDQADVLEWKEFHSTKTNNYGLVNLVIGEGTSTGQGRAANFSQIPWNLGNLFVGVTVNFGRGESNLGAVKLQSVPYALVAQNALTVDYNNITNKPNYLSTESDPVYLSSTAAKIKASDTVRWSKPSSFTGNYNDLLDKPDLTRFLRTENDPTFQSSLAARISIADTTRWGKHFSGNYGDLRNKPTLASIATTGNYNDLNGKPTYATVATSGNYQDLINKPNLGNYISAESDPLYTSGVAAKIKASDTARWSAKSNFSGSYTDLRNKPTFSTVATSGNYQDLANKPNLGNYISSESDPLYAAGVASKIKASDTARWGARSGFSGDYNDLTNKPVGQNIGDMLYWNGTKWAVVPVGNNTQMLSITNGKPAWINQSTGGGTSGTPQVVTNSAAVYRDNQGITAYVPYIILNSDGTAITSRGVCWGTSSNPTINSNKTIDGAGLGSFTSNLFGLTPGITIYARAYATTSSGVYYGNEITFIGDGKIQLTAQYVYAISSTKAQCSVSISSQGGYSMLNNGLCWSTNPLPTISNNKSNDLSTVTGLTPNTKYYIRAYATNATGTYYSNELSFTTGPSIVLLNTNDLSSIRSTSVNCSANIIDDGGVAITSRGICWGTSTNPLVTGNFKTSGSGLGSFSADITGLIPNTKYYVRAYATNSNGTTYGNELSFTTAPSIIRFASLQLSDSRSTSVYCSTDITDDGGYTITSRGVCWGTSTNPLKTGNFKASGSGTGSFSTNITGLTPNTKYYVRAYATNSNGTSYGEELSITTKPSVIIFSNLELSEIKSTSVYCRSSVTDDGGFSLTAQGICWSTSPNPTIASNIQANGLGPYVIINRLTPNTKYYVRAYATNSNGTSYGEELSFTTAPSVIIFTPLQLMETKSTSVYCSSDITDDGGYSITSRGFCWGTSSNPLISGSSKACSSGIGSFSANITGLVPNTKYYVRAYATNSNGTSYGEEISFTTTPSIVLFSTLELSEIKSTSAYYRSYINDDGGFTIVTQGVCWGTTANPTIAGTFKNSSGSDYITGLTPNTKYYVRAFATNSNGTSYGEESSFTTAPSVITFNSFNLSSIKSTSVYCRASVADDGGFVVTTRGVCWSTSPNPSATGNYMSSGSGIGSYNIQIPGLTPNTKYYVRAYAINSKGTFYGEELSFTTIPSIVLLSTSDVSSIRSSSVTCNMNISDDGGYTITSNGICWGTSSNPTTSGNYKQSGSGIGSFNVNMTGLTPNTKYYARAYAINSKGTYYGNEVNFTTNPAIVTFQTPQAYSNSCNSGQSSCSIIDDGANTITAMGFCWSTSPHPTTNNSVSYEPMITTYLNRQITSLSPNTTYYLRAFAVTTGNTFYSDEVTFKTTEATISVYTNQVYTPDGITANCNGSFSASCYSFTESGFCYAKTHSPSITDKKIISTTPGNNISATITGLDYGSTYYMRAYVKNGTEIFYGDEVYLTTGTGTITLETTNITDIKVTSATANSNITNLGGLSLLQRGTCWSTNPNPTIKTGTYLAFYSVGEGNYTTALNNLLPNKTYYVRAYAINAKDTFYAVQKTFTTLSGAVNIATVAPTNVGSTVATSGGTITSAGADITDKGVCWSVSPNPTVSNSYISSGFGNENYTASLTGLSHNTKYYIRAYAINAAGVWYGNELNFTTQYGKVFFVTSVSNIGNTVAQMSVSITDNGEVEVTDKGVCWSTNANPTVANNKTSSGTGINAFYPKLTGLLANTRYYARAYAVNSEGTWYSEPISFTTKSTADLTDADGNKYLTVTINGQTWMAENLRTTRYQNGDPIPNVKEDNDWLALSSGARCFYNNDQATYPYDGPYYNYYTIMDSRKLCPTGWHVPSLTEWTSLFDGQNQLMVGGSSGLNLNSEGYRSVTEDASYVNWIAPGGWANYWTSTPYTPSLTYIMSTPDGSYPRNRLRSPKSGLAVRCIKD